MKEFLCLMSTYRFPDAEKGKKYKGVYQGKTLWLIDEFYLRHGINEDNFDVNIHGTYVNSENRKNFKKLS